MDPWTTLRHHRDSNLPRSYSCSILRYIVVFVSKWWGDGVVVYLEQGADLHTAQLMPLPLTVSCFSKIQIGFTFRVPSHPCSSEKGPFNGCVCVLFQRTFLYCVCGSFPHTSHVAWSVCVCASGTRLIRVNTTEPIEKMRCRFGVADSYISKEPCIRGRVSIHRGKGAIWWRFAWDKICFSAKMYATTKVCVCRRCVPLPSYFRHLCLLLVPYVILT